MTKIESGLHDKIFPISDSNTTQTYYAKSGLSHLYNTLLEFIKYA